jgi:hypothetical protein
MVISVPSRHTRPQSRRRSSKKGRVIGREKGRIVAEDLPDRRRFFKFLGQETPHLVPVPSGRMRELPVKGKIAFVKRNGLECGGFIAVGGQVENRQIEKIDGRRMVQGEVKRLAGAVHCFGRCAEKKINIGGNAGLLEVFESGRDGRQIDPLGQGIQHRLIAGFHPQLEHDTARGLESR